MGWLSAPQYWLARSVFEHLLGLVYLVAFVSVFSQFVALVGDRGLVSARPFLRQVGFRRAPSLFHLRYSDRLARTAAGAGMVLSAAAALGLVERAPLWASMLAWALMWVLYLSFVNAGQVFFGFVWETLLLEAGFLAIFLGNDSMAPSILLVFLLRWLLCRLEVGAGLIKLRNDPAWRNLTALRYHHETQPLPNRWSWRFHHLPDPVHRAEVAANHLAQLVVPFALFCPQPVASAAAAFIIVTQLWLMASGNFAWLNLLTITLATAGLDNAVLGRVLPVHHPALVAPPAWFGALVVLLTVASVVASWPVVRNMASAQQVMNSSYNPLRLVNTYGLFGHITRVRLEVVLEGTDDPQPGPDSVWQPYGFKAKPGDPARRPRQVAPYHLRLDWLMWFAALSPGYAEGWLMALVVKLLENDRKVLRLMGHNPFPEGAPRFVRARLYLYRFTRPEERRSSGLWWKRELVGEYLPAVTLRRATRDAAAEQLSS